MATVFDIAAHIHARLGNVGRLRTNKLAYYVQAWSLVWREQPAFNERIEAWKDGPVVKTLWISQERGEVDRGSPLTPDLVAHVDRVLVAYGHLSGEDLIALTHSEDPWRVARGDTPDGASSSAEITYDSMVKFYGHQWIEAERDNMAAAAPPEFTGSVDELEKFLTAE